MQTPIIRESACSTLVEHDNDIFVAPQNGPNWHIATPRMTVPSDAIGATADVAVIEAIGRL
jgi:hypothetical protein